MAGSKPPPFAGVKRFGLPPGRLFYFAGAFWGLTPVAMYLMHSVASASVMPLDFNQSMSRAASVAVMLCSTPFYLLPGYFKGLTRLMDKA